MILPSSELDSHFLQIRKRLKRLFMLTYNITITAISSLLSSQWSRSSQTGEYLVCDLAETTTKSTNSWLISNFIDLQGAASVSVKVEFTARQCDLPSLPFCRQSFKIFSFQRDNMINAGVQKTMIEIGQFTLAGEVNASNVWNSGQRRITNRASLEFGTQSKGLYLGFQDVGGCIALGKVQLSSNFCPGQMYGGVSYNRTPSPPSGNSTKVYGKCSLNSESLHHVNSLYMECLSNGSWSKPASALTCLCKPGYQLTPKGCQGKWCWWMISFFSKQRNRSMERLMSRNVDRWRD